MSGLTDRLRGIAGQATPGPWHGYGRNAVGVRTSGGNLALTDGDDRQENAEHIATFDPQLVVAMLDVIDAAEKLTDLWGTNTFRRDGIDDAESERLDDAVARFREVAP